MYEIQFSLEQQSQSHTENVKKKKNSSNSIRRDSLGYEFLWECPTVEVIVLFNLLYNRMWCLSETVEVTQSHDVPRQRRTLGQGALWNSRCFIQEPQSLFSYHCSYSLYLFFSQWKCKLEISDHKKKMSVDYSCQYFVSIQEQRLTGGNVSLHWRTKSWHKQRIHLELSHCLSFVVCFCFFVVASSTPPVFPVLKRALEERQILRLHSNVSMKF